MTDTELIKHILYDYPINYLMYPGGAGGEFLSNLICNHSSMFKKFNKVKVNEYNRTLIEMPKFFKIISLIRIRQNSESIDYIVETIKNQQKLLNYDFTELISEAIEYLSDSLPPLVRCHMSRHSYFFKNTYCLLPNNELWYSYSQKLLFIKVLNRYYTCNSEQDKIEFFRYEIAAYANKPNIYKFLNEGLEWVIKNNIDNLSDLHLYAITTMENIPELSINYIFSSKLIDLYNILNDKYDSFNNFYDYFEPYYRNVPTIKILYTKLFEKGYLEDIFNIQGNEFHNQLISWHETNLELMSNNNIDYTKYKL